MNHFDHTMVAELSKSWVAKISTQLTVAGRPIEGGWPGTLSEARRLLISRLDDPTRAISRGEFDRLVRGIYDDARSQWLALAGGRSAMRAT